jgi:transcription elongation factor Elf1
MTIKNIPAKVIHICDGCQAEVESKDRPKYWTKVHHYRDAYDFQGNAVAGDNIELMLCAACTEKFTTAINDVFKRED